MYVIYDMIADESIRFIYEISAISAQTASTVTKPSFVSVSVALEASVTISWMSHVYCVVPVVSFVFVPAPISVGRWRSPRT